MYRPLAVFALLALLPISAGARAQTAADVYEAIDLKVKDVLSGTSLGAKVLPGADKQLVSLTTYMTGKQDRSNAVNVRLDVLQPTSKGLEIVYTRDFGSEQGGFVGEGNLELFDLDMDGTSEIIVSYRSYADPGIEQQIGEVIVHEEGKFRTAWTGPLTYDATGASGDIPVERRDHFVREVDLAGTLRTRGVTLFITKRVVAVAGESLPEPKTVRETFPLRIRKGW